MRMNEGYEGTRALDKKKKNDQVACLKGRRSRRGLKIVKGKVGVNETGLANYNICEDDFFMVCLLFAV